MGKKLMAVLLATVLTFNIMMPAVGATQAQGTLPTEEPTVEQVQDESESLVVPQEEALPQEGATSNVQTPDTAPVSSSVPQEEPEQQPDGWVSIDGKDYFYQNGSPLTGWFSDGGYDYYADESGAIQKNQVIEVPGPDGVVHKFLMDENGRLRGGFNGATSGGFFEVDGNTYFASNWKGYLLTGWFNPNGYDYYADENGVVQKDKVLQIDGKNCAFAEDSMFLGNPQPGQILHCDALDKDYYFDENLVMAKDKIVTIDGNKYYFKPDGTMLGSFTGTSNGGFITIGENTYFGSNWKGYLLTGWFNPDGYDYYADENGVVQMNKVIEVPGPDGVVHKFLMDESGRLKGSFTGAYRGGFVEIGGNTYYSSNWEGRLLTGWFSPNKYTYYADENGVVQKDVVLKIDGKYCAFDEDGIFLGNPQPGKILHCDVLDKDYYFDADLVMAKDQIVTIDGYKYYFKPDGTMLGSFTGTSNGGFVTINGNTYFGSNWKGYLLTGWFNPDGYDYYADENGVVQIDKIIEVEGPDGEVHKFLMDENGRLRGGFDGATSGGFFEVDGNTYFASNWKGYLLTGWFNPDGYDYYADENGVVQMDRIIKVKGPDGEVHKFLMDENGRLRGGFDGATSGGFFEIDGNTYFASNWKGYLLTGWFNPDGRDYYADENGVVQKDQVIEVEGPDGEVHKFLLDEEGRLQGSFTGENYGGFVTIDGKLYFASNWKGYLLTGWFSPNSYQYYAGEDGVVLTGGWYEVDGKKCYFDEDGRYAAPPKIQSVTYTVTGTKAKVTINAEASPVTNIAGYSWDGGKTWVATSEKEYAVNTTIAGGTLQVKDALGQITVYASDITIKNTGPYHGIDVSAYQGVIDWEQVKASGVDFAIIRALTWSNSVGYYVIDPYFEYNVRNAKANGIKVGAYLYSYAFSTDEIIEEVQFFHNSTQMKALRADGITFDYPVYIDFEWGKILEHTDYNTRTQIVRTGMVVLEQLGYYPGYYTYHNWAVNQFDAKSLYNEGYDFWYARYPSNPDIYAGTSSYLGYEAQMWQYSSSGSVQGISGNVDLNICYVDYSSKIHGSEGGEEVAPTLSVYDQSTGKLVTGQVNDILAQIVQTEVGGANNADVYKAQAIAAYSWILYEQEHGNSIPSVKLSTPSAAVKNAVNAVAGTRLTYGGETAFTPYGAASAAYTNSSANMWGNALPYLTNVTSPESNYRGQTRTIDLTQMTKNVTQIVSQATANATAHDRWLTDAVYDEYGYLISIKVCGTTVTGSKFYDVFYPILSPNCRITYNAQSDSWTSSTDGYGHCVGMSQWGAITFARNGWNYTQILSHYYPGTKLS